MISGVHSDRFGVLYATSRELVKRNAAADARRYVLAMMDVLREMYECASVVERAKITVMLKQWLNVAAALREQGVTREITEFYGLSGRGKASERAERSETTSKLDGIYDTEGHDWCADIFERYKSSVVTITGSAKNEQSSGTGFVIRDDGYILTNRHVVWNESSGKALSDLTMECDGDSYGISVVSSDRKSDVALCAFDAKATAKKLRSIPTVADYSGLRQGADVLVIGNAFSLGLAPFTGTVRFTRDGDGNLVYTAPSNPGDSGGPVLNRAGECVGINKSITTSFVRSGRRIKAQGLTNATPADKIQKLLAEWL